MRDHPDFFAKAQEARELIKNRELNLYISRDRLSHRTKIIISRWAFGSQPSAVIGRVRGPICYKDPQNKGINLIVY